MLPAIIPVLFFCGCKATYTVTAHPAAGMRVEKVQASEKMEKRIAAYRSPVQQLLAQEVAVSPMALEKGLPESELSNLIADAVFAYAKTWAAQDSTKNIRPEFCLLNSGGIRTALPAGMLTLGQMYEVMPFENEIVLLKLTPANLKALVDYVAEKGGAPVAGIRLKLDGNKASSVEIDGKPFAFDREVWVATSDFLAYGGDGMTFFARPQGYEETRIKVRDAITGYFKQFHAQGKSLPAVKDGRISR